MQGQRHLLQVVLALRAAGRLAGLLDGRQEQPHEHGDDGNHNQELDKCEAASLRAATPRRGEADGEANRNARGSPRNSEIRSRLHDKSSLSVVVRPKRAHDSSRTSPRGVGVARRPVVPQHKKGSCIPDCGGDATYGAGEGGRENPAPAPGCPRSGWPVTTTSFPRRIVRMSDDWAGLLASGSNY